MSRPLRCLQRVLVHRKSLARTAHVWPVAWCAHDDSSGEADPRTRHASQETFLTVDVGEQVGGVERIRAMTAGWEIPESEIEFRFTASGGPGGQHANRANTKVDATFRLDDSATMPDGLRERIRARLGDVVRVTVDDERSQLRNRELAVERLRGRVRNAGVVEKKRRATKPTRGSQRRRVEGKRRRSEIKRNRRRPAAED